jgi:hypothetical protein
VSATARKRQARNRIGAIRRWRCTEAITSVAMPEVGTGLIATIVADSRVG